MIKNYRGMFFSFRGESTPTDVSDKVFSPQPYRFVNV